MLVSSHVLSEVEQTVDDVVIIAKGRLVHASSLRQLEAMARPAVKIVSPDADGLSRLVREAGWEPSTRFDAAGVAVVYDRHTREVGAAASGTVSSCPNSPPPARVSNPFSSA